MSGSHHHDALPYADTGELCAAVVAALRAEAGPDDVVVLAGRPEHGDMLATAVRGRLPGLRRVVRADPPVVHNRPAVALAAQRRLAQEAARQATRQTDQQTSQHTARQAAQQTVVLPTAVPLTAEPLKAEPLKAVPPTAAPLTAERSTAEQAAAARVWYIAEPDVGTTRVAWRRAADYEAACGFALASCALTTVCAYPRSMFGPVLETVRRTHPRLLTADGPVPNPAYRDVLPAGLGNGPALPEPAGSPVLHIAGSVTLAEVAGIRARLAEALRDVPALVRTDFVAAVNEVLTNAYLHGIPPVDLTVWASAAWIEGRVTDRGRGFTDPLAGYVPESDGRRAHAGLWLVRQACDEFDTWRTPAGFTVRVATPVTADLRLYTAGR